MTQGSEIERPQGATTGGAGHQTRRGRIATVVNADIQRLSSRYERTMHRVERTTFWQHLQRVKEADLVNAATLLAAIAFMSLVPVMIIAAAVSPLGSGHSLSTVFTERMGLSPKASTDVQHLFATGHDVRRATGEVGIILAILFAYQWPSTLRHGFEVAWKLPPRGVRDAWRGILWILVFLILSVLIAIMSVEAENGTWEQVMTDIGTVLIVFVGTWWTQHLLLAGRVSWRALLPGSVAITIGLVGLRWFTSFVFSSLIISNEDSYGAIGTIFMLLSWVVGFSVVMLGGAVIGNSIYETRLAQRA